jgi:hypothetical protein
MEVVCRLEPNRVTPLTLGRIFRGAENSCFGCHRDPPPAAGGEHAPAAGVSDGWIRNDEVPVWLHEDRHAQAYAVLLSERSQNMGRLLGVAEIHRDARCVACHSGFPVQSIHCPDGLLPVELASDRRVTLGVSCEACHGASGDARDAGAVRLGWNAAHNPFTGLADWRYLPPEKKQSEYGYYDVRSPLARSRMCLSCHVGKAQDGRVVTHEMYAAGHPPLANVELSTFIEQMPAHWRSLDEKPDSVRAAFLARTTQRSDPAAARTVRNVAVASAVAWSEQLRLTADLAAGDVAAPATTTSWPELAQFECSSCHHELRTGGWRPKRASRGAPGRPVPVAWPAPLLEAVMTALRGEESARQLEAHRQAVASATTARPFGLEPQQLRPLLLAAADWADGEAAQLEKLAIDDRAAVNLLAAISEIAAQQILDYESARQLTWAFREVLAAVEGTEKEIAGIRVPFAAVTALFVLDLRGNRLPNAIVSSSAQVPVQTLDKTNLSRTLESAAGYDAEEFSRRFAKVHDSIALSRRHGSQ